MRIHADVHLAACVAVEQQVWTGSLQAGVRRVLHDALESSEMRMLEGGLRWHGRRLAVDRGLRLPRGEHAEPVAGAEGAHLYLKLGSPGGPLPLHGADPLSA